MTDVTTLLAGVKTRADKATEGPWRTEPVEDGKFAEIESRVYSLRGNHVLLSPTDGEAGQAKTPDATFIAAARTDIPRLVAALEAVENLAERLRTNRPGDPDSAFDRGYAMGRRAAGDLVSNIIAAALGGGE